MSRVDQSPEADPLTLLGRDLRQFKAQHRVSIFDLKNEQKAFADGIKVNLEKILTDLRIQVQQDLATAKKKREESLLSLRRQTADFGEKIAEIEIQLRLMGGNVEEEINRYKDASEQIQNDTLRELGNLKRLIARETKEQKASIKRLQAQIVAEKRQRESLKKTFEDALFAQTEAEERARKPIQAQITQLKFSIGQVRASSDEQIKTLQQVVSQVDQLIEKILPAVNQLGGRLDKQEEQVDTLNQTIDVDSLNQHLKELTGTIDVQRQSLEMLGTTLTSEVDKQKQLLQETLERLKVLELK